MEAAVRHAALRDPTAPASPWTMQKPWMCAASCACLRSMLCVTQSKRFGRHNTLEHMVNRFDQDVVSFMHSRKSWSQPCSG